MLRDKEQEADPSAHRNLHFISCSINAVAEQLFASLPPGVLRRVSILFPDPWAHTNHRKRRIVQPLLVQQLAAVMPSGSEVVLVCDYEELALDMCTHFDALHAAFERRGGGQSLAAVRGEQAQEQEQETGGGRGSADGKGWLTEHPLPARSEREAVCEIKWRPVYRAIYTRR